MPEKKLDATFIKSCQYLSDCPTNRLPEYAFIGRSNVGKSSLINMLTDQRKLAKISGTPGKTQLLNFFLINNAWYLVDLPGYGYAKRSKKARENFDKMISSYLNKRNILINTFVLIDSRIDPQEIDLLFMRNMAENELPFTIVFTKSDKLKPQILEKNIAKYKQKMLEEWDEMPDYIITSSLDKTGRNEIIKIIESYNRLVSFSL